MVSQIGALNSLSQSSQMNKLTDATKQKLEALGIDTSSIKTEAQGQAILTALQNTQKTQNTQVQPPNKSQQSGSNGIQAQEESIREQAKELAKKLGVTVNAKDDISEILGKIATALANMRIQSVNSPEDSKQIDAYQKQYDSLVNEVNSLEKQKQASKEQLSGSLDAMALYNKIKLGLG